MVIYIVDTRHIVVWRMIPYRDTSFDKQPLIRNPISKSMVTWKNLLIQPIFVSVAECDHVNYMCYLNWPPVICHWTFIVRRLYVRYYWQWKSHVRVTNTWSVGIYSLDRDLWCHLGLYELSSHIEVYLCYLNVTPASTCEECAVHLCRWARVARQT